MNWLIFCLLVGYAFARPDVGLGYNYRPPPSGFQLNIGASQAPAPVQAPQPIPLPIPVQPPQPVQAPSFNYVPQLNTGFDGGQISHSNTGFINQGFAPVKQDVTKHIYIYSAPQEPQEQSLINIASAPRRKNYKIIFIKAPSYQSQSQIIAQQQQLNSEKTLIYVLSKKPDYQNLQINAATATAKHSKPEVYFIRYKAKQEVAPAVVAPVQTGHKESHEISNDFDHGLSISNKDYQFASLPKPAHTSYGPPKQSGPY